MRNMAWRATLIIRAINKLIPGGACRKLASRFTYITLMITKEACSHLRLLRQRAANSQEMRRRSEHCYGRWRRGSFTWLWVGDNPYVATSEGEVGDLLHLPSAEGRQPHSIKLEVFALKLNRRARRVCLALGHPRNEPPVQEQQNAHTHENSFFLKKKIKNSYQRKWRWWWWGWAELPHTPWWWRAQKMDELIYSQSRGREVM